MSDLRIENSQYVVFILQRENNRTLRLEKEPEGWQDDDLEIVRNKTYHGILTQFTGGLKFRGEAKDFMLGAFDLLGLNGNVYLTKMVLRVGENYVLGDVVDNIKFKQRYRGLADFNTLKEKDGAIEINFNSQELEQLVKSHESDDLSIGRIDDIDNKLIPTINLNNTFLKGRDLVSSGYSIALNTSQSGDGTDLFATTGFNRITIPTVFGEKGFGRNVEVTMPTYDQDDALAYQANMFYDDLQEQVITESRLEINVKFRVKFTINSNPQYTARVAAYLVAWDYTPNGYVRVQNPGGVLNNLTELQFVYNNLGQPNWIEYNLNGLKAPFIEEQVANTRAYSIEFWFDNFTSSNGLFEWSYQLDSVEDYRIDVTETSKFDSQGDVYRFAFVNEVASRLMEIITGEKNKFYSNVFGRALPSPSSGINLPPQYQDYSYSRTGEWGNIGLMNGFDIRRFSIDNELYKDITISLKTLIDSLVSQFNIGVGIEDSQFGQRLRFEPQSHFYRRKTIVRIKEQVSSISREVDPKMYNSACSFGSAKGGDYEFGLGLDEPNIKSDFITPLRKTSNKYDKISQIRSDETGQELLRRQPEYLDPTEDRTGDDNLWFLDLKLANLDGVFEQLEWEDALVRPPIGVLSPNTYHNWRFTPKRSLYRHGWVLRAGLEQEINLDKVFTLGSSNANINLETEYLPGASYLEQSGRVSENGTTKVRTLDPSIILPEIITFTHPVSDELLDLILGTTEVEINGTIEEIPNWYFKFSFINEEEEEETGHLISLKPKTGEFKMYKANEKLFLGSEGITPPTPPEGIWSSDLIIETAMWIEIEISGMGYIDWGDWSQEVYNGNERTYTRYFEPGSYVVEFFGTLTSFSCVTPNSNFYHDVRLLPTTMTKYINEGSNDAYGNLSDLPVVLEIFVVKGDCFITGDIQDIPQSVKRIIVEGENLISGDVGLITSISEITELEIRGDNTISQYTGYPIVFNSLITRFRVHQIEGSGFDSAEVDNIIIDLYNSGMYSGDVELFFNNAPRTSLSDVAFTGLIQRGVIVDTN